MLETIYNDFVTKVLPAVQEGLVISKEYFFDLFGRYVKYLIVIDSILLAANVFAIIALIIFWRMMATRKWYELGDGGFVIISGIVTLFSLLFALLPGLFINTTHLIKDIYIPEVRVYEELKPMMNK